MSTAMRHLARFRASTRAPRATKVAARPLPPCRNAGQPADAAQGSDVPCGSQVAPTVQDLVRKRNERARCGHHGERYALGEPGSRDSSGAQAVPDVHRAVSRCGHQGSGHCRQENQESGRGEHRRLWQKSVIGLMTSGSPLR